MAAEPSLLEVEEFLSGCEVDLTAADELRFCAGEVKAAVLAAGQLDASWNPSEELLARIRAASNGESGNVQLAVDEGTIASAVDAVEILAVVEDFLVTNGIDEKAADELRGCPQAVQEQVVGRGELTGARNPSAALLSRIRDARKSLATEGNMAEQDVEVFIASSGIDDRAADTLRGTSPHVQQTVMARGDLTTAKNPSAAVLARIRDAEKEKGGGGGGANGAGAYAAGAYGAGAQGGKGAYGAAGGPGSAYAAACGKGAAPAQGAYGGKGAAYGGKGAYGEGGYGGKGAVYGGKDPGYGGKDPSYGGAVYGGKELGYGGKAPAYGGKGPDYGGYGGKDTSYGGKDFGGGYGGKDAGYGGKDFGYDGGKGPDYGGYGGKDASYGGKGGGYGGKACGYGAAPPAYGGVYAAAASTAAKGYGAKPAAKGYGSPAAAAGPAARAPAAGSAGTCHWITVDASSSLVAAGLPQEAVAIEFEKGVSAFGSGSWILGDLVADYSESCTFEHDGDWTLFPEVGEAWKAAGQQDNCYTVARCDAEGKWAVGVASGKKNAERAARLALGVALAYGTPKMQQLCKTYPEFGEFCISAGLIQGGKPQKGGKRSEAYDPEAPPDAPAMKGGWPAPPVLSAPAPGGEGVPEVVWVTLGPESRIIQEGLPADAPAISYSKALNSAFSNSYAILSDLVGDISAEVALHHDPDWKEFPEVGEALKQAGGEENSYTIGTCATSAKWAVGIGGSWKNRESATRLALSVAIASGEPGKIEQLARAYPEFGALCASCGLIEAQAPTKRARHF